MTPHPEQGEHTVSNRAMELVVSGLFVALSLLVMYDNWRIGARWMEDGPQAGYFPFYIGLIICLSSVAILGQSLFGRASRNREIFVEWQPLRQVLSVLLPALLFVLAIQLIGLYTAAAIYIAGFMMWLGGYSALKSVLLGVLVSAIAFVTFEVWFQVPLYKGAFDPLAFLGY